MSQEIKRYRMNRVDYMLEDVPVGKEDDLLDFVTAADFDAVVQERDVWKAKVPMLAKDNTALRAERADVQGALTDAGTVPVDPLAEGVRHLTAERDALARRVAWQPIETAPKDGTWIIGCDEEGIVRETRWKSHGFNPLWRINDNSVACWYPILWMPLPAPPAQEGR